MEEHTVKLLSEEEAKEYGRKWAKQLRKHTAENNYGQECIVGDAGLLLVFHGKFKKYDPKANKTMIKALLEAGFTIEHTDEEVWIYARKTE